MESPDPIPSFSAGRRWWIAFNAILSLVALVALLVMVNYLASGHFIRWQAARHSALRLSRQTTHVLADLTNDVAVTIFFDPRGDNAEIYNLTAALLIEYQSVCRHIRVQTLDYTRFPGEAKELLDKHRFSGLKQKDLVIFESNGRSKSFYAKQLADYDFSKFMTTRTVRKSAFRGEMLFTRAIVAVSYPQQRKAYFTQGHGEHDPGAPESDDAKAADLAYSKMGAILKDEINCDWDRLSLLGTNTIPADCQLLIIAGPDLARFGTNELDKIDAYLKQGGRLLALLNGGGSLDPILEKWGVRVGDYPINDKDKRYWVSDTDFLVAQITPHPIMNPLAQEGLPVLMVMPRAVEKLENASKVPGAPDVTVLASTSDQATDGREHRIFPLMAAVEQGGISGVSAPRGGTRMVVAGDSHFLDDQMIDTVAANHYFAGLALNWLLESPEAMLEGLGPRPITEYKLIMTKAQSRAVRWLFLAGLPGGALFLGGLVWLRRRN